MKSTVPTPGSSQPSADWKQPLVRLVDRLLNRLHRKPLQAPRLTLLERINLAPRQSLVLVEAEGQKLLIALSAEAAPAFCVLDREDERSVGGRVRVEGVVW